jgi:hypothetical protein
MLQIRSFIGNGIPEKNLNPVVGWNETTSIYKVVVRFSSELRSRAFLKRRIRRFGVNSKGSSSQIVNEITREFPWCCTLCSVISSV